MTIKKRIYTTSAVTFVVLIVLASMTIWTHKQVISNLRTRDQLNEQLIDVEKFARWKNELIRSVSDIVASGHVPPSTEEFFNYPLTGLREERAALVTNGKELVTLIGQKERSVKDIEKTFSDLRIQINNIYYNLDKKIATVLAIAQMDQVLGSEVSEKNSLAPYVLKSLNQLTLVAQNGLIARNFSEEEIGVVARNRQFLDLQLHLIDPDGSIEESFSELFALIESIRAFIRESNETLYGYNTRIESAKNRFDQAARSTEVTSIVRQAQTEVKLANKALATTSRRTMTTVIVFLLVIPVLVLVFGILGLNSYLISPITSLVRAMKDVENGRFDVSAPIKARDEIGDLARAFNTMAAEIKSKVLELSTLNHNLKESETKYRTLVDNLPQKIFLKRKDFSYVSCNLNYAKAVGINDEEIVGKTDFDFFPKELANKYIQDDQRIIQTGKPEEIEEIFLQNGEELIIQTVKTPIRDESGNITGVLGIFWDITERKKQEEELHLARFSLENASIAILWINSEGQVQYVNKRTCSMLGYNLEEMLDLSIWDFDSKVVREHFALYWSEMMDEKPRVLESILRKKDGTEFPVEVSVQQSAYKGNRLNFAFISDITERKEAERSVLESRELHRSIIQTAMDGFWVVDFDGRLREVNEAYCRMSGYTEEELLSLRAEDLDIAKSDGDIKSHMKKVIKKAGDRFEAQHRRKDGKTFDVEMSVQYRTEETGRFVCFIRDVTQQKKLEAQLLQAQKMEAVGTLAGGVAHDFNNLLQAINGYTQILLMKIPEDATLRSNLLAIEKSGDRATELVKQLLLFSRKADSVRRPIGLNEEMEHSLRILERTIPKMIEIQVNPGDELWNVLADPVQIEQILLNLGNNAADAMPEGGTLTISTENVTLDQDFAQVHLDAEPGRYVLLSVSDTGNGMDSSTLEHVFEPFFTTKSIGEGTGLGLASVYGIVKSHGGAITCYSEIGQATVFKIYLPACDEQPAGGVEAASEEAVPLKGSETILIVDDEEVIRDFASQIVEEFGYQYLTASNGEEALEIYSGRGTEIDLVILDIGMPGMGGHKCLEELLKIDPNVKVLIASGYSVNGNIQHTIELGAKGYVGKPYRLSDLMGKIRAALDEDQ